MAIQDFGDDSGDFGSSDDFGDFEDFGDGDFGGLGIGFGSNLGVGEFLSGDHSADLFSRGDFGYSTNKSIKSTTDSGLYDPKSAGQPAPGAPG